MEVCPGELSGSLLTSDAGDAGFPHGPRPVGSLPHDHEVRRCIVEYRLKRSGVDLIEHMASLNVGTFSKEAFLDEAVDLRPDFRDKVRRSPTR